MTYRILVPLDGSPLADRAIPWADELAGALHSGVDLLRVLERAPGAHNPEAEVEFNWKLGPLEGDEAMVKLYQRIIEKERTEAESALSQARREFRRAKSIQTIVEYGSAEDVIVARAQATAAGTVIVIATHGHSGLARALLGNVAAAVIRRSGVPVLAVRADLLMPPHAPRRVLIPLDTSGLAEGVLAPIVPLAQELDWSLVLFSVVDVPPPTLAILGATIPLGRVPDRPPAEVMDYLDHTAAELRGRGITVDVRVGSGDRAQAIVRAAHEADSGVIAMSTHGRHGVGRLAFGSVTEAVIRHAEVPVLAVHPPRLEARAAVASYS